MQQSNGRPCGDPRNGRGSISSTCGTTFRVHLARLHFPLPFFASCSRPLPASAGKERKGKKRGRRASATSRVSFGSSRPLQATYYARSPRSAGSEEDFLLLFHLILLLAFPPPPILPITSHFISPTIVAAPLPPFHPAYSMRSFTRSCNCKEKKPQPEQETSAAMPPSPFSVQACARRTSSRRESPERERERGIYAFTRAMKEVSAE